MMGYTTLIMSNGSKWAGEPPDDIPTLLGVLAEHPLRRTRGGFITTDKAIGTVRFSGNFADVSHAFNIETDDPEIIESVTAAMRKNWCSAAYRRQCGRVLTNYGGIQAVQSAQL